MSERVEYFDILKGLAIFSVVAIHSSGSGLLFNLESINFNFTVFWRNALNFSVPMFLAISGYFLAKKEFGSRMDYFSFIKKQVSRVYFPFIIWSLVWFSIYVLIKKGSLAHELYKLITFQSSGPYYFIALIIQYYILLPILNYLANLKGLVFSAFLSIVMTCLIAYLRYFSDISMPLVGYAGNFLTWLVFFVLGLFLGRSSEIEISNKTLIRLVLIFYVFSCAESYLLVLYFDLPGDAVTAVKMSSFIYSLFLIIFLFKNQDLIRSKILKKLGEVSFGIYLIHMFSIVFFDKALDIFSEGLEEYTYLYQLALVFLVLLSCFFAIQLFNKVFPYRWCRLVGFK